MRLYYALKVPEITGRISLKKEKSRVLLLPACAHCSRPPLHQSPARSVKTYLRFVHSFVPSFLLALVLLTNTGARGGWPGSIPGAHRSSLPPRLLTSGRPERATHRPRLCGTGVPQPALSEPVLCPEGRPAQHPGLRAAGLSGGWLGWEVGALRPWRGVAGRPGHRSCDSIDLPCPL